MTHRIFGKIKTAAEPFLAKAEKLRAGTEAALNRLISENRRAKNGKNKGFIHLAAENRHTVAIIFTALILVYYGIGATVSSKINNTLNAELKTTQTSPRYITAALTHVLKTQVDDSPWTPALPIIFPAAILDNLPNFQLGVKDAAKFLTKRLSSFYASRKLKEAEELLGYPADIWLFSQTENDKLAPGSAKQYRKALAKISDFGTSPDTKFAASPSEYVYLLKSLNILLQRQITNLTRHVQEHNSELIDFKADNIFYKTQGVAYVVSYMLTALLKDYQDLIVRTEQYEEITSALKSLESAVMLDPIAVKNAATEDAYAANHLIYLAFYLSQASKHITEMQYNTILKLKEDAHAD